MPAALFILIGCQLIGEVLRAAFHLPIPGPVIGMFLLAAALAVRDRDKPADDLSPLRRTSDALITHMGLLFVPAGVGVIAEAALLRSQWVPIVAGLIGSTVLGLMVTGLVMHRISRTTEARPGEPRADYAHAGHAHADYAHAGHAHAGHAHADHAPIGHAHIEVPS